AALLGYQELIAESARLITEGLVPNGWITLPELPELAASGDPVGKSGLVAEAVRPFEDVFESLAGWPWQDDDDDYDDDDDDEAYVPPVPHINPARHVGRNDPCPCGSGKKFKNCHLVLE